MNDELSPLEKAILNVVADAYRPKMLTSGVRVTARNNTGAGRFTYLKDSNTQELPDGGYSADYKYIEMEGVPYGLGFVVDIRNGVIAYIEIAVNGNNGWDGIERPWRIR